MIAGTSNIAKYFVYDGGNVVLDFVDTDGHLTGTATPVLDKRYFQGPGVDHLLAQENVTQSTNSPNRVWWVLPDHLGSTRDAVTATGGVIAHFQFDSFGNILDGRENVTRYQYTGREHDSNTDLNYHRARWYDPVSGKWISEDPIGLTAGDPNFTRYVGNGVLTGVDPSGLKVYAIGGTQEKFADMANTARFYSLAIGGINKRQYWDGTGSGTFTGGVNTALGASNGAIADAVVAQIISDYDSLRPREPVNIVGWSRGAIAAIRVARILGKGVWTSTNSSGDRATTKGCKFLTKIPVNWLGLFDPVSQHFRGGWSTSISTNVRAVSVAWATETVGFMQGVVFSRNLLQYDQAYTAYGEHFVYNFDNSLSTHSDVGGAQSISYNDALPWMVEEGRNHGIQMNQVPRTIFNVPPRP